MANLTRVFLTTVLISTVSFSNTAHANGLNFPILEFPGKAIFPIRKLMSGMNLAGLK